MKTIDIIAIVIAVSILAATRRYTIAKAIAFVCRNILLLAEDNVLKVSNILADLIVVAGIASLLVGFFN